MKDLAIELANRDRDLEEALGMSIEELESQTKGVVTTTKSELHKAIWDSMLIGMDLTKMEMKEVPAFMNKKTEEILERFPTLGEKLGDL